MTLTVGGLSGGHPHRVKRLSLPTHGLIELLVGFALMGAPFLFGFGGTGTVAAIGLGVLLTGLALSGTDSLPLAAHLAFDQLLGAALVAAALGLALAGDRAAGVVFLVAAVVQLALSAVTRYTRPLRVSYPARF